MSIDGLAEFLAARLDEWENLGRQALPWQTGSRDEGQPAEHVSWRRSAGGVEFGLRGVEADRKLIAAYAAARATVPPVDDWYEVADGVKVGVADGLESALKIRAAMFAAHPDYRPEWKP